MLVFYDIVQKYSKTEQKWNKIIDEQIFLPNEIKSIDSCQWIKIIGYKH